MTHEIQRRLDNGFGITAHNNLVMEYGGAAGARRLIGNGRRVTTVTSAQVLALFGTPITVLPAPGSGIASIIKGVYIYKPAGTAYAGIASGEDLVLKYTNAAGQQVTSVIETTGFLDQTTAQRRYAHPVATTGSTAGDITPVDNAAVVLHLLVGEITTGDSPLYVEVHYDEVRTVFTS